LDYGAGTGEFAAWAKTHLLNAEVTVADSSQEMLNRARQRGLQTAAVPLPDSVRNVDLVTMFDVLEHIEDDADFLKGLRQKMTTGGVVFISVPAHPWMYGAHDKRVGHYRRYTSEALKRALEAAGFRVLWMTWYNFFLFPAMIAMRLRERNRNEERVTTFPPLLNALLLKIFSWERWFVPSGLFPIGASLIVVAKA
jgi:SAM-dependent methyltransferase